MAGPNKKRAIANDANTESGDESDSESYHGGEVKLIIFIMYHLVCN